MQPKLILIIIAICLIVISSCHAEKEESVSLSDFYLCSMDVSSGDNLNIAVLFNHGNTYSENNNNSRYDLFLLNAEGKTKRSHTFKGYEHSTAEETPLLRFDDAGNLLLLETFNVDRSRISSYSPDGKRLWQTVFADKRSFPKPYKSRAAYLFSRGDEISIIHSISWGPGNCDNCETGWFSEYVSATTDGKIKYYKQYDFFDLDMIVAQSPIESALFTFSEKSLSELGPEGNDGSLPSMTPYLTKTDMSFNSLWVINDHDIFANRTMNAIVPDKQGGVTIVLREAEDSYEWGSVFQLIRFNENGEESRRRELNPDDGIYGINTIAFDGNNELIIGSYYNILKLDAELNLLWSYEIPWDDGEIVGILPTRNNTYWYEYIHYGNGPEKISLGKLSEEGSLLHSQFLWTKNSFIDSASPRYLKSDENGNVYSVLDSGSYVFQKISPDGEILWKKTFKP